MELHSRRWLLNKLLHLGTGLAGLALLGDCTYEKISPLCEDGPKALLLLGETDGLTLYGGTEYNIRWIAGCVAYLRIDFSHNHGLTWQTIAERVAAQEGQYPWEVPQISSQLAQFRLLNLESGQVLSTSESFFQLIPTASLLIKDHPTLNSIGGVVLYQHPVFDTISIIRTAVDRFTILNLNCTHNGCPVDTPDQGNSWVCPCHGSEFSKLGCVKMGPARRPLALHEYTFNATTGELLIYLTQRERQTC
ncbi:MAG: Rieske 2Fe-2S domain-containing protein [Haliscomenobacter sp.]|uniref:QcrA and Rieske domain-containing protein n=1 Tax=Haliscomenobacter sp. TaxID=2717303 RepID=UPI0029A248D5|nr:Rieske 2Fe-2S domain-containing protein [Haliscomenobacter sp.]MDX2071844.1 Rieske 2Fe-2S domain-containing protein [Haliscomenobacter sp.]